jgi:hypothetical protein
MKLLLYGHLLTRKSSSRVAGRMIDQPADWSMVQQRRDALWGFQAKISFDGVWVGFADAR